MTPLLLELFESKTFGGIGGWSIFTLITWSLFFGGSGGINGFSDGLIKTYLFLFYNSFIIKGKLLLSPTKGFFSGLWGEANNSLYSDFLFSWAEFTLFFWIYFSFFNYSWILISIF